MVLPSAIRPDPDDLAAWLVVGVQEKEPCTPISKIKKIIQQLKLSTQLEPFQIVYVLSRMYHDGELTDAITIELLNNTLIRTHKLLIKNKLTFGKFYDMSDLIHIRTVQLNIKPEEIQSSTVIDLMNL